MELIKFKEHNIVIAENQKEYLPIPAFLTWNREGEIITCWKLSFKERIKLLFTGKLWHSIWTFNCPVQPQRLEVNKPVMLDARNK